MKRFVWRLQRVLQVKAKQEQVARAELMRLTEKMTRVRRELMTQKRLLAQMLTDLGKLDPQQRLRAQELFLKHSRTIDERIKQLQARLRELEIRQSEQVKELLKLKRFREGLEKLREQAYEQFLREQDRLEQKQLDEMSTVRFARQKNQPVGIG